MKSFKNILFIGLLLSLVSCGVVQVTSDYDRTVDFTQYKTYSFHQKGIEKLQLNDLDKRRILQEVENQMAIKGYTKVSSNPDLYVNILASSKEKISINNDYDYYWGMPSSNVSQYTSGTIVIDLIDDKKNTLVWQGTGNGLNVSDVQNKAERIPQAIQEILKKVSSSKEIRVLCAVLKK